MTRPALYPHRCEPCQFCGVAETVLVDREALELWQGGALAQVAFPWLSDDNRELLISGTHPDCWERWMRDPLADGEYVDPEGFVMSTLAGAQ